MFVVTIKSLSHLETPGAHYACIKRKKDGKINLTFGSPGFPYDRDSSESYIPKDSKIIFLWRWVKDVMFLRSHGLNKQRLVKSQVHQVQ